jgi:SNF2 family DNA or RNA helicase
MIRLQQIASGFVVKDDGTIYNLPNVKLEYLDEALPQWTSTDGDHKAILFCRFRHDAEVLASLCDDLKIGHVALTGDTSKNASELVKQFQNDPETRVFIGNIQVASVGITLTAADYCCFYNNSFALGDKLQAIDRPYRIGQTRKVTYYDLVCRNTIDETALYNLREKRSLATATIKNLKEALL